LNAKHANGGPQGEDGGAAVPPNTRAYAVGDCHGCLEALRELREAIVADSARADAAGPRAQRRVVVYLGDYIDRGPDSRGVIDLLIGEPLAGFETIHMLGNHEALMRGFLDGEDVASVWMMNGGIETMRSYGLDVTALNGPWPGGDALALRDALAAVVPQAHRAFLDGLALCHIEGDYFFVHAGLRPGLALDRQDPADLIWIREPFLSSRADHGKVVVHGHSAAREPEVRANRIGIDTGACYGGKLTALVLEDDRHRFLQV
jgi:serine/threonine protein phosphatase 1